MHTSSLPGLPFLHFHKAFRRARVPCTERRRWISGREVGWWQWRWQWRWVAELQCRHPASIGRPGWEVAQSERADAMSWGYTCGPLALRPDRHQGP